MTPSPPSPDPPGSAPAWADSLREQPPGFQRRIVALLCFAVFFSVLNGTMFNVAVPDIAGDYQLSPTQASWVVSGFVLVFALGSVTYGKLADIYPVRALITIGLLLFNCGSLLGFLSESYGGLLFGRLVQAAGASAIPALAMYTATRVVPPAVRGRTLGAVSATVAFATGIGPLIGGSIAGALHWRYLFCVSLATLAAIPLFRRTLPKEPPRPSSFDLLGGLLLGTFVCGLLLYLTQNQPRALLLALVALAGLIWRLRRAAQPFIAPELFADRRYCGALLTAFLALGAVFGMMFHIPLLLRSLHGLGTIGIGWVIFPGAMSAALLGMVAGRLADRWESTLVVQIGLLLLVGGFLLLSCAAAAPPAVLALVLIGVYAGFAGIHASLAKTVSLLLPLHHSGVGLGVYNLSFFLAGAFGAAFTSRLLEAWVATPALNPLGRGAAASSNIFLLSAVTALVAALLFHLLVGAAGTKARG